MTLSEIFKSVNAKNIQAVPYVPIVWMMKFSHKTPTLFIGDSYNNAEK